MADSRVNLETSGEDTSSTSERRGRWNRTERLKTSCISYEDSHLTPNDVKAAESIRVDRRWRAVATNSDMAEPMSSEVPDVNLNSRTVYTIGTWRVSREVYMEQLVGLGVKTLIDIRGNPKAGREDKLHRGKDFTRTLANSGIQYEYWGDKFGEDQMQLNDKDDLRRSLKGLLATVPASPLCFLGHMHEPHKCHRLILCNLLPAGTQVLHLMWKDHQSLYVLNHVEAKSKHDRAIEYFREKMSFEQKRRPEILHTSDVDRTAIAAISVAAAKLHVLKWEDTTPAEWENRLRDGCAYRLVLPWDTEILWYPHFLSYSEADALEHTVHDRITMYHPTYNFQTPSGIVEEKINRKGQAKLCDDFTFKVQYSSGGDSLYATEKLEPWSRSLLHKIEAASETVFNAIWFNHYRDGTVTIHWHADSDEGLGPNALIGSLSLGATRDFCFKSKRTWTPVKGGTPGIIHLSLPLFHGSLIVMGNNSQTHWLHAVPAMEGVHRERTNLTFRFYAHEDLAVGENGVNEQSKIRLQNSKLLGELAAKTQEQQNEIVAEAETRTPVRLRLSPDKKTWGNRSILPHPILIDCPSNRLTTVAELCSLLCDQLLPMGIDQVQLAISSSDDFGFEVLQPNVSLMAQLECRNICEEVAELLLLPTSQVINKCINFPKDKSLPFAWPGMLATNCTGGAADLHHELQAALPGPYVPFHIRRMQISTEGDWLREVLQNLSGIQRKNKGRGQVSHFIFHQCSEFIAVYTGRPKSSIHLLIAPKRLLKREELSIVDAPMVSRMSFYASHLASCLSQSFPGMLFAAGVRLRPGRVQHFHAHLLSMDLVAPRFEFLERRHVSDFTSGVSQFLPLDDLACRLAVGYELPTKPVLIHAKELMCHRCGHRFADAMLELSKHFSCCQSWPADCAEWTNSDLHTQGPSVAVSNNAKLRTLEDMGFGACGSEALQAALLAAGGSVEGAVAQLVR